MKVVLGCLCTVACGFQSPGEVPDASAVPDAASTPDAGPAARTREGLIGLWEFDETSGLTGAKIDDTSTADPTRKVPLIVNPGTVTLSASTMTPDGVAVVASDPHPHLNSDVKMSLAVTLEAWVTASDGDQGSVAAPAVIAGLSASIKARNISLMQAGKRWLARVRTTADPNGLPDLISTTEITPGVMTHLVVVADATHRILYVDGKPDSIDPVPGPPLGWDKAYKMVLGDEITRDRQWAGTFALVAMYDRVLAEALVETNYVAGPSGK